MNTVLDLSVVIIVALFAFGGYKKGAVSTLIGMFGSLVASVLASVVASFTSITIYTQFVMPEILKKAAELTKDIPKNLPAVQKAEEVLDLLPDYVSNVLNLTGVTKENMAAELAKAEIADIPSMIEAWIRPTMIHLVSLIVTMVAFVVITIIFSIIAKVVTSASDHSILGLANHLGGMALGIAMAAVIIMVLSLAVYMMIILMPNETSQKLSDGVNHSIFFQTLNQYNIPDMIINKLALNSVLGLK